MLKDYLIKKINNYINLESSKLLDIGCGTGRIAQLLGDKVKSYYGIDLDKERLDKAKAEFNSSNFEFKKGSAENIPYEKKFSIVFFSMSWHMLKDFEIVLKEVKRVLKKDGILIILEPTENTNDWASPRLRKGNAEFNERSYQTKLESLKTAEEYIKSQELFKIVLEDYNEETKNKLLILKNK